MQNRYQASVSPQGHVGLRIADQSDTLYGQTGSIPTLLVERFTDSMYAGLTCLVSNVCDAALPVSLQYWRSFTERYFQALCRQQTVKSASWNGPKCPDEQTLNEVLAAAPPMMGLEFICVEVLQTLWSGLDQFTRLSVKAAEDDLAAYLHSLRPEWNLVGRVTFHLAENKKNPDRPFAFLATYSEGKSKVGTIEHVPLAEALKQSIASKNSSKLDVLLEPVSRAAEKSELIQEMLQQRTLFSPQAWGIKQAFQFLISVPAMEQAGVIVRVPNWWNASKPPRPQVQVRIGANRKSTISGAEALDLEVNVVIDGQPLTAAELESLMVARQGMTLLRGKWVQVDQDHLQSALKQWKNLQQQKVSGLGFLEGLRLLSGVSIDGQRVDEEIREWSRIEPGPWLNETLDLLRNPSGKIKLDPHHRLNATLRPYQADGVRWLWFATQLGLGVCLADDMGLGKTIQVISLLLQLKYAHEQNPEPCSKASKRHANETGPCENHLPSLLVMPTSLLSNWKREVERFAPDLRILIVHASATDAKTIKQIAANPQQELQGYDLVATTYGLARRQKWLAEMEWRMVILDEAQAIKNAGAAQSKAIKSIPSQGRIIMTGTPVENHLGDLWSLFDFCSPGLLGTASQFKKFVKADDQQTLSKRLSGIRKLIRPYVLRRMKTDPTIVADLPDKTEMRVFCGLTQMQAALYREITREMEQALDNAAGIQRRGMVLAALMQLKQICNHPSLYLKQSDYPDEASGKYRELSAICKTLVEKQEKLLVFTQFQSMCAPLSAFLCNCFGRAGLVLTGKTPSKARGRLVEQFQQDDGPPHFVISVKAGGIGLNLTAASHVVHFDRWWNPAVEDQATDRAFRIGQKKNVIVHKFVCRGTLEEKIDDLIHSKKELSRELFGGDGEIQLTEMSNEQLLDFVALDLQKASSN